MTDITERLRAICETGCDPELPFEAADTIDALRAELAALKKQEPVAWYLPADGGDDSMFRDAHTVAVCTGTKRVGWQPLYAAPMPQAAQQELKPYNGLTKEAALAWVENLKQPAPAQPQAEPDALVQAARDALDQLQVVLSAVDGYYYDAVVPETKTVIEALRAALAAKGAQP